MLWTSLSGSTLTTCEVLLSLDVQAASDAALEANRALSAAKNAEIRRAKTVLLTEGIQALQKKVKKGKGARVAAVQEDRQNKVGMPWSLWVVLLSFVSDECGDLVNVEQSSVAGLLAEVFEWVV